MLKFLNGQRVATEFINYKPSLTNITPKGELNQERYHNINKFISSNNYIPSEVQSNRDKHIRLYTDNPKVSNLQSHLHYNYKDKNYNILKEDKRGDYRTSNIINNNNEPTFNNNNYNNYNYKVNNQYPSHSIDVNYINKDELSKETSFSISSSSDFNNININSNNIFEHNLINRKNSE